MKNKFLLFLTIFMIVGAMALTACTTNRRPTTPAPGQTRTLPGPTRVSPPTTPTPGATRTVPAPTRVTPPVTPAEPRTGLPAPGTNMSPGTTGTGNTPGTTTPGTMRRSSTTSTAGDRAKQISQDVAKEKNIKSATCVVTGDTALVGLQFDEQFKGDVTDSIKKSVDKRVKKIDSSIKRVVVTADPDLLSRIKTVAKDIENGKPLSGFTTEVEEIIRRINPF